MKRALRVEEAFSWRRIVFTAAWFSLAVGFVLWAKWGARLALSYVVGSAWMMVNFWALAVLLSLLTAHQVRNRMFIFAVVYAKIGLVYLVLYWLFRIGWFDHLGLVAGISTLLMVILFKALGRTLFVERNER